LRPSPPSAGESRRTSQGTPAPAASLDADLGRDT
jgi:hypothetical protein